MDPRKIFNKKGQIKKQTGDLIIEGDVEENSEIEIKDGSLEILGTIKDGAKIKISVSEALRESMEEKQNRGTSISSVCSVSIGNTKIGDVSINNRIFTSDPLTDLGNGRYEITPLSESPYRSFASLGSGGSVTINGVRQGRRVTPVPGLATVLVDGIQYQGKKISIDGNNVLVDGKKIVPPGSDPTQKPKGPLKLIVHGNVGNNVSIDSDVEIEIRGTTGSFCQIKSNYSKISANNIGEETHLDAYSSITCADIDKGCDLKTQYGDLNAKSLKNSVSVTVNKSINIQEDIGNECYLSTEYGELTARNIGDHVTVNANKDITVNNIGSHSKLKSQYYGLTANNVENNVQLHVNKDIIVNHLGDYSSVTSEYYNVTVRNSVMDNVTITAKEDITVNNLGNNNSLTSQYYGISVGNAGMGNDIHANKDITVTGICPDSRGFRSSFGRVHVAPQPAYQAPARPATSTRVITSALPSVPLDEKKTENKLNIFNKTTQAYIDSFKNKTSHAKAIEKASLSPDAFEEYCDPISAEIINIPVLVNGHVFDLESLIKLPESQDGTRKDPFNREEFYLCYIQPAFDFEEKIKEKIQAEIRAKNSIPGAPGGPSFQDEPKNSPPGGPGF